MSTLRPVKYSILLSCLLLAYSARAESIFQSFYQAWKTNAIQEMESFQEGSSIWFFPLPPAAGEISVRVSSGSDDAEQSASSGAVSLTSNDLELVTDFSTNQVVGLRFTSVSVPQGARIVAAYVEFEADEVGSGTANMNITGEATDDASTFTSSANNISGRSRTAASVSWTVTEAWAVDSKYKTSNISSIVQEIVDRDGWVSGNDIAIIIEGSGTRTAESYEGEPANAPSLVIVYDDAPVTATVTHTFNHFDSDAFSFGYDPDPSCSTGDWESGWVRFNFPEEVIGEIYNDGSMVVYGRAVNENDSNDQWDIYLKLINKRSWSQWSALGRTFYETYPGGLCNANINFWDYYELDSNTSRMVGVTGSSNESKVVTLGHRPTDLHKAVQVGFGAANNSDPNYSSCYTFDVRGWSTMSGDLNLHCCDYGFYGNVREVGNACVISNGDFEDGLDYWNHYGTGFSTTTDAYTGNSALLITGNHVGVTQNYHLATPGYTYMVTGFGKLSGSPGYSTMMLRFYDENLNEIYRVNSEVKNSTWSPLHSGSVAPEGTVYFGVDLFKSTGSGSVYYDEICVAEIPSTTQGNCEALTNSGFESNITSAWNPYGSVTQSTDAAVGTRSALMGGSTNAGMSQAISASPGVDYYVEFQSKISGSPSWAGGGVTFYDASWNEISSALHDLSTISFYQHQWAFTSPPNTAHFNIWFSKNGGGNLYVDEICLNSFIINSGKCPNLLINQEFDEGTNQWSVWNYTGNSSTFSIDNTSQLSGTNSAYVDITAASGTEWHVQLQQENLSIEAGKEYSISFEARASDNKNISLTVQRIGAPHTNYFWEDLALTTAGTNFHYTFTSDSTNAGAVGLRFLLGTDYDDVWIDNVVFAEVCPVELCENNLLTNPSFESGSSDWNFDASTSISTDANTGINAAQLNGANGIFAQNYLGVTPGDIYKLELYAKNNSSGIVNVGLKFFDDSWSNVGTESNDQVTSTTYDLYYVSAKVPEGATRMQVFGWQEGTGTSNFDDFCLTTWDLTPATCSDVCELEPSFFNYIMSIDETGDSDEWKDYDSGGLLLCDNGDGTLTLKGNIINGRDADWDPTTPEACGSEDGWYIELLASDLRNWDNFGGNYVVHSSCPNAYLDLDYYDVSGSLTGLGCNAGKVITVDGASAGNYRLQIGHGGNSHNCGFGLSTWFNGSMDGQSVKLDIYSNLDETCYNTMRPTPNPCVNTLFNHEFNDSDAYWNVHLHNGSVANMTIDNVGQLSGTNSAYINISNATGTNWHTQVSQSGQSIEIGKTYEISFDAKAVTNRTISVALQQVSSPFATYSWQDFVITTASESYSYEYTATLTNSGDVGLYFHLGQTADNLWLDNVSVKEVCDCVSSIENIDFETDPSGNPIVIGDNPNEIWATWGVHLSTTNGGNDPLYFFNSSSPPSYELDAGTPNEDFGGAGIGSGGGTGTLGENNTDLGTLLIISESSTGNQNIRSGGGIITIDLDTPTDVAGLEMVDVDYNETEGVVTAYDASNNIIAQAPVIAYGPNSYQKVILNAANASKVEINFAHSFALASIMFCDDNPPSASIGDLVWNDVNGDGSSAGEVGIANVSVILYDNSNNVLARTTTDANGLYSFDNLVDGQYKVVIQNPVGYSVVSNVNGGTGNDSGVFALTSGQVKTDVDFGLQGNGSGCDGAANAASGNTRNGAIENATGNADGLTTEIGHISDYLVLTLADELPVGTEYTIHISGRSSSATSDVFEAPDGTTLPTSQQETPTGFTFNGQATGAADVITQVTKTTSVATKYLYFDRGSGDIEIDAVTYSLSCVEICNNGIDDDGDGIIDCPNSCANPLIANTYNVWHTGGGGGLDFNQIQTSGPQAGYPSTFLQTGTSSNMVQREGGATYCHPATGEVLIYSDGEKAWDKDGNEYSTPDADNKFNTLATRLFSAAGTPLIVSSPGQCNMAEELYIFFTDDHLGAAQELYYVVVDVPNKTIGAPTQLTSYETAEQINAVQVDCDTIWLVFRDELDLNAIRWTPSGFEAPVVTSGIHTRTDNRYRSGFSLDGTKYAASFGAVASSNDKFLVCDFNQLTGQFVNPIYLDPHSADPGNSIHQNYGVAFSPDGTKLYTSVSFIVGTTKRQHLLQYDLNEVTEAGIENSEVSIAVKDFGIGGIQNGPDGRLYISNGNGNLISNETRVHVVDYPNLKGTACNFRADFLDTGGNIGSGLNNIVYGVGPAACIPVIAVDTTANCNEIVVNISECYPGAGAPYNIYYSYNGNNYSMLNQTPDVNNEIILSDFSNGENVSVYLTDANGCASNEEGVYLYHTSCPESCDNGIDDDGDGLIDCSDPDCDGIPNCPVDNCGERNTDGLVALYNFQEGIGSTVYDVSNVGAPVHMTIANTNNVTWLGSCGLSIDSETIIESNTSANKISNAIKASNAFTVETWIKPSNLTQNGPARIVTLSDGGYDRNFTLGQDYDHYSARFKTTTTDNNGYPTKQTGSDVASIGHIQHVTYTWDGNTGEERILVDGVVKYSGIRTGNVSNWDDSFKLAFGNEIGTSRDWLGEIYMVAIYDKVISSAEVNNSLSIGYCCNGTVVSEIDCSENRDMEIVYAGIKNNVPASLDISETLTIDSIVVEVAYDNSNPGSTITVEDHSGNSYTADRTNVGGVVVYRTTLPPTTSISYSNETNESAAQSLVAYVFRKVDGGKSLVTQFMQDGGYHTTIPIGFNLPTSSAPQDLTIQLPVTELSYDNRILNFTAIAGDKTTTVTKQWGSNGSDFPNGCCMEIVELTLEDVTSSVLRIEVESPSGSPNGQSFAVAGTVAVGVTCENREVCGNGIDDDGDGDIDCDDSFCDLIDLRNITVSNCIDHPLQDVATLDVEVHWNNAPANDTIEVNIYGKTEYIDVASGLTSPQSVSFVIPANGMVNNPITASWRVNSNFCGETSTYDAPITCSNDQIACDILFLCGLDKPYDGDAWDHGWIEYLDEVNGSATVTPVLTKNESGMATYDPMNINTPISVNLSDYGLVVVSATTEGHISTDMIVALKDFEGAVLLSNYKLVNDFGMAMTEATYTWQSHAFVDDSNSKVLYNFDNQISPWTGRLFTEADYSSNGTGYLWASAGDQSTRNDGFYFVYDASDALPGVASDHGKRVFLGYHMNGFYANDENGGNVPSPVQSWFSPAKHLTLDGKFFLDQALLEASVGCNVELCNNGQDDDGDGLTDCEDSDCELPTINSVNASSPDNCPAVNNGQITVDGSGSSVEYSIDGGLTYQASNVFSAVTAGTYNVRVRIQGSLCYVDYDSNPIMLNEPTCNEICDNSIDDDGDGLVDCADPDCGPMIYAGTDVTICVGTSIGISVIAEGTGPFSYNWNIGSGQSHIVSPGLGATTYTVTVTDGNGCMAVDQVVVTVSNCSEECADGIDNDGDGLVDCDDPACQAYGQPRPLYDSYVTCPGVEFIEQVIFNDDNLQSPEFSIYSSPSQGSVSIDNEGIFTYSPFNNWCGVDEFIYEVCNQNTGCCDTASVFLQIGDNEPPILQNIPADLTIGCDESIPEIPVTVYGEDTCPGIYISFDEESNQPNPGSCQTYEIIRTWTVTDLCGNSRTGTQKITVLDVEAPEIFRVYTLANGAKAMGGVSNRTTGNWKYIEFPVNFETKPIVFTQVVSENDMTTINGRIRNVSVQGFELKLQEEENQDGIHPAESVAWMAIEKGTLDDATNLQVNELTNVNNLVSILGYENNFSGNPSFVAGLQTTNENDPVGIRFSNPSPSTVNVFLEEEASGDTEVAHGNENMGYFAMEPGVLYDQDDVFVGESGSLLLDENWKTIQLTRIFSKPVVIFGGIQSGTDPAVVRVKNVTSNSFDVRIEEWETYDDKLANKTVSYFVMEGSIPAASEHYCSDDQVALEPGINLFAVDNCDEQLNFDYVETSQVTDQGMQVNRSWTCTDDCGNSVGVNRTDTCVLAAVRLNVKLGGAMIGVFGQDLMRDDLRQVGYIPIEEPYSNLAGFNHEGMGGGETTTQEILNITGDDAIVDWVFIEIRDRDNPADVQATCSALLQRDGDVVGPDGESVIYFPTLNEKDYFVTIRHRNHLGLMTQGAQYLSTNAVPDVQFDKLETEVTGQYEAGNELSGTYRACWAGDLNSDGKVIYQGPQNDVFTLFSLVLSSPDNDNFLANYIRFGYHSEDLNMDGKAIFQGPGNDRALILYNTVLLHPGNGGFLGNYIVSEVLP